MPIYNELIIDNNISNIIEVLCKSINKSPNTFYNLLQEIIVKYEFKIQDILLERDKLQSKIDTWLQKNKDNFSFPNYYKFLEHINYIIPLKEEYKVTTTGLDYELKIPGPQLVCPADNVKFIKVDKQYNSMRECQNETREEIIKLIKELDFKYDWKVAKCTDSQVTTYLYPDPKKKIEQEKDYEVYSIKTKTIN